MVASSLSWPVAACCEMLAEQAGLDAVSAPSLVAVERHSELPVIGQLQASPQSGTIRSSAKALHVILKTFPKSLD